MVTQAAEPVPKLVSRILHKIADFYYKFNILNINVKNLYGLKVDHNLRVITLQRSLVLLGHQSLLYLQLSQTLS